MGNRRELDMTGEIIPLSWQGRQTARGRFRKAGLGDAGARSGRVAAGVGGAGRAI